VPKTSSYHHGSTDLLLTSPFYKASGSYTLQLKAHRINHRIHKKLDDGQSLVEVKKKKPKDPEKCRVRCQDVDCLRPWVGRILVDSLYVLKYGFVDVNNQLLKLSKTLMNMVKITKIYEKMRYIIFIFI
jgi:hypothetical protein